MTGRLQVVVGLYRSDNGERLAVMDSDGRLLGDSVTVVLTEVPGR
jgi:hypothetical protein